MRHSELLLAGVLAIFAAALTVGVIVWYSDVEEVAEDDNGDDDEHEGIGMTTKNITTVGDSNAEITLDQGDTLIINHTCSDPSRWLYDFSACYFLSCITNPPSSPASSAYSIDFQDESSITLNDISLPVGRYEVWCSYQDGFGPQSYDERAAIVVINSVSTSYPGNDGLRYTWTEDTTNGNFLYIDDAGPGVTEIYALGYGVLSRQDDPQVDIDLSSMVSCTIASGVTGIGDHAFEGCDRLVSVTLPDTLTDIGDYAFSECTSLSSISLPSALTYIGDYAFLSDTSITLIFIYSSLTHIGQQAFYGCTNLATVCVEKGSTLGITKGSTDNGYVAYYATPAVYDDAEDYAFDVSPSGSGTVTPAHTYLSWREQEELGIGNNPVTSVLGVVISATPAPGYSFDRWVFGTGASAGTVTAVFIQTSKVVTISSAGNGSVSPAVVAVSTSYVVTGGSNNPISVDGTDVTATPDSGYKFFEWVASGDTLTANFVPITYTIAFRGGEGATGTTSSISASYGTSYSLPSSGFTKEHYTFSGWRQES